MESIATTSQIKNALKAKALAMSGGVPSKGAKVAVKAAGVAKKLVKKAKKYERRRRKRYI